MMPMKRKSVARGVELNDLRAGQREQQAGRAKNRAADILNLLNSANAEHDQWISFRCTGSNGPEARSIVRRRGSARFANLNGTTSKR